MQVAAPVEGGTTRKVTAVSAGARTCEDAGFSEPPSVKMNAGSHAVQRGVTMSAPDESSTVSSGQRSLRAQLVVPVFVNVSSTYVAFVALIVWPTEAASSSEAQGVIFTNDGAGVAADG